MKEFLDSVLNNIKNRVGTPFLSSFLFAFIAIHWKAVYVVLFYGKGKFTIGKDEFSSSLDYILKSNYTECDNLWWPLLIGFVYALFVPWLTHLSKLWDKTAFHKLISIFDWLKGYYKSPEEVEDLENQIKENKEELEIIKKELDGNKTEYKKKIEEITDEKNTLAEKLALIKKVVKKNEITFSNELEARKEEINNNEVENTKLTEEITTLSMDLKSKEDSINQLNDDLQREINNNNSITKQFQLDEVQYKTDIQKISDNNTALSNELKTVEAKYKLAYIRLEAYEKDEHF